MKSIRSSRARMLLAVLPLFGGHFRQVVAWDPASQEKITSTKQVDKDAKDTLFSLETPQDMMDLRQRRAAAVEECTKVLDAHAAKHRSLVKEGLSSWDHTWRSCAAASFLGEMRASDEGAIRALCDNISLGTPYTIQPNRAVDRRLNGRPAMQALVQIGNQSVVDGILVALKNPLGKGDLWSFAIVLELISSREIALEQIRLGVVKHTVNLNEGDREQFERNIKQIQKCLKNPELLRTEGKWIGDY